MTDADKNVICTGVRVQNRRGDVGLITAAHCLYVIRNNLFVAHRSELYVPTRIALSNAQYPAQSFDDCMRRAITYSECVRAGDDVAFIPTDAVSVSERPWRVCASAPTWKKATVFGYGRNRDTYPTERPLQGAMTVRSAPRGLWTAIGEGTQATDIGDSGGPVISATDDSALDSAEPAVCFVASGVEGSELWFQPVWDLDARIR